MEGNGFEEFWRRERPPAQRLSMGGFGTDWESVPERGRGGEGSNLRPQPPQGCARSRHDFAIPRHETGLPPKGRIGSCDACIAADDRAYDEEQERRKAERWETIVTTL